MAKNVFNVVTFSRDEFDALLAWRDANLEHVRASFLPVLNEGSIEIHDGTGDVASIVTFQFDDGKLKTKLSMASGDVIAKHLYDPEGRTDGMIKCVSSWFNPEHKEEFFAAGGTEQDCVQDVLTTVVSTMAYMLYSKENIIESNKRRKIYPPAERKKGRYKSPPPYTVLINGYTLKGLPVAKPLAKKKVKMALDAWGVRGHWRRLASGKKIFIKPYVKGKNRESEVHKKYIIKVEDK